MERKLEKIFDYQKFEQNAAMQQIIDSVHARFASKELSMNDMGTVYAAGVNTPSKPMRIRDTTTTRHA